MNPTVYRATLVTSVLLAIAVRMWWPALGVYYVVAAVVVLAVVIRHAPTDHS